jgi:hypothetical protein
MHYRPEDTIRFALRCLLSLQISMMLLDDRLDKTLSSERANLMSLLDGVGKASVFVWSFENFVMVEILNFVLWEILQSLVSNYIDQFTNHPISSACFNGLFKRLDIIDEIKAKPSFGMIIFVVPTNSNKI